MSRRVFRNVGAVGLLVLLAVAVCAAPTRAAAGPLYDIKATWGDTNLPPGGEGQFVLQTRNIGDGTNEEEVTISDQLPPGVTVANMEWLPFGSDIASIFCTGQGTETVTCSIPGFLVPILLPAPGLQGGSGFSVEPNGYMAPIFVDVAVGEGLTGSEPNSATISSGGVGATDADQVPFSTIPASFGLVPGSFEADPFSSAYPFGEPVRQAGDHPFEQRVNFDLTEETGIDNGSEGDGHRYTAPTGLIKDAEVTLPRGLVGNPEATPKCNPTDFASPGATANSTACPADTQVGYLNTTFSSGTHHHGQGPFILQGGGDLTRVAIYNIKPPKGVPADFGFNAGGLVLGHIYPNLDPAQNYAIKTLTPDISSLVSVKGAQVTFWGVPGDPAHDAFRYYPEKQENGNVVGAQFGSAAIRPLLTNPMDCGFENGGAKIRADSYEHPGEFTQTEEYKEPLNVNGCEDARFRFKPEIALQPSDAHADAPTGLDVHLEVPQRNDEVTEAKKLYAQNGDAKGISTPPIKKAVVTLPLGMTLSPSAAQGLGSCSSAQVGLGTNAPVTCPENSQFGRLTLHTPILPIDAQPEGFIYIAKQGDNPFHNFLSIYLVIEEPERGILVKVPGKVDLDPTTGQITTTFDDLPQLPVSDMQMTFKGGVRAGLVEPGTCGTKTIRAEFFTWQDPGTPQVVNSSYEITQKSDGSPCVRNLSERSFRPTFDAGTTNNTAGRYSPFVTRLTRSDDDQEFSRLGVTLPPGLAAKFAGVGICPDARIAQAISRTAAGDGGLEQSDPSCPASSLVGTTDVGAGVGATLTYVPGKVFLAGPYRGAPISLVVITPAVVGPFDLGVITVRTALDVNRETAQGSATTDPFPQIFQGIPVRIRDIRLNLDRPDFTLNPTSCAEKQIRASLTGAGGDVFSAVDDTQFDAGEPFQAADCANLGFKPSLSFRLSAGNHRGAHPKLRAVLTYPKKGAYANVAAASVALPRSEFLDQGHIKTVCTRVQFAANQCPAGSIYGHAVAKTPLFGTPLEGPVYLRSSSHKLPDLVAALKGPASQPVEVDLDGHVDSVNGGIRNTFEVVPDAPVETFTLTMKGGKKGLLVNSTNLCTSVNRATARFTAQNGRSVALHPLMRPACPGRGRKGRR